MAKNSGLSLSFLDVLSCSLGGMILLFLIFATLKHHGDRKSRSDEGVVKKLITPKPVTEVGDDEIVIPALFEVTLSDSNTILSAIDDDGTRWSVVTRRKGNETEKKSIWHVFIEDSANANGKFKFDPESVADLEIQQLAGIDSNKLKFIRSINSVSQELKYSSGNLEIQNK